MGSHRFARIALGSAVAAALVFSVLLVRTAAQAPGAPPPGAGLYPEYEPDDDTGFTPIFDGKTLNGWEGDANYWRVENGCLVGEITPETLLKQNSFIIWRGGTTGDFELKIEFRNFRLKKPPLDSAPAKK